MLTLIVLIILAVLLFGASAVIGVAGWILGFVVASTATAWASIVLGVPPIVAIGMASAGFFAMVGLLWVVGYALQSWQKSVPTAGNRGDTTSPAYKEAYDSIRFRQRAYADRSDH
jgi:hypothetical protein